jgi:two-component system phosphate regulon sensor histidine kinase PhoR
MEPGDQEWVERRAINVIGHELRTPTSTVRGIAEVLSAESGAPARPELVEALLRNSRRLEALVDDLLTATSVTTSLPVGPTAAIALSEQVEASWPEDSGLEMSGSGSALARRSSVRRILAAVYDNARTYGRPPLTVTIAPSGDNVRVAFDSPGPDLPAEDVRLALEPFWRGERAVTAAPGLGLGLTVAATLARHEGGRLWVEARPGGGLVTHLELPAA